MPLPIVLIAIGAGSGLVGLYKGHKARKKLKQAKNTTQKAQVIYDTARDALEKSRKRAISQLDELGNLKLEVWSEDLGVFVSFFERIKDIEIVGKVNIEQLQKVQEQLVEMKEISLNATQVLGAGTAALGAGALAGVASYGGAMAFASASTGTAISALSGAAATKATLAWFGGGSLATGGLGIVGGTWVLGGVVAGPLFAIGGLVLDGKARKKVAEAQTNLSNAQKAVAEMENTLAAVESIGQVATTFHHIVTQMREKFKNMLTRLEKIVTTHENKEGEVSYISLSENEQKDLLLVVEAAHVMKTVLEKPLLTEQGDLRDDCNQMLDTARTFLND